MSRGGAVWRVVVVAVGLLVLAGLLGWMFGTWRGEDGLQTSANVAQLVGVLLTAAPLVVALVLWWRRAGPAAVTDEQTVASAKQALAIMVASQWREEARIRDLDDPDPMPVRWKLTTDPRIMDHAAHITNGGTLTWSGTSDQITAMAGRFRALRRRRLVILGAPGSGKTTLAVQLVRELLTNPAEDDPVPVLVSVAGWDTQRYPRLQGWLAARLAENYPSLRAPQYGPDAAGQLVQRAQVLPVLDGLDEVPTAARLAVITALNRSLADADQLVLTSRTREFTDAATARDVLTSAAVIQPEPLTEGAAAGYLASCLPPTPPRPWADTLHRLRTGGAPHLAKVVSTPLGLWLLSTTHVTTRTDPSPLTDPTLFPSPAAVRSHLFDRLIPAVIDARPPSTDPAELFRPRRNHDPDQATRWLGHLANLLDQTPTRDLAWWRLAATAPTRIRLAGGLTAGLTAWAETPAATGRSSTPVTTWRADRTLNLLRILAFGLTAGLTFGLTRGQHHAWPAYLIATFWLARRRRLPRSLMAFLDDAHRLGLLRTVGPIYQFRHAEFHDHLAARYRSGLT